MLIENKFIYLSLPRRGSTSFHYSCILADFNIQTVINVDNVNSKIDFNTIDVSNIMNYIEHGHETLVELKKKFISNYPIIAVKRDRHEAFYSLYKHVVFDLNRAGATNAYEYFKNINLEDLFFYNTIDLYNKKSRWDIINEFLLDKKIIKQKYNIPRYMELSSPEYIINIIDILITPSSYWHNNDSEIIWFDIKDLAPMSKWVSDITRKPFELKNVNSSKHMDCNLKLDSNFIDKYNSIYDYYDLPKSVKTLI
jgi:hypothetical protein